jgi:YegS/Rv2252/BmrU family lipid kinase
MRASVILNPNAGPGDFHRLLKQAISRLEEWGWQVDLVETAKQGDGIDLAERAAKEGYDVAIAVGGDGTINEVVNGLAGSQTALAVIPAGTGNVFATDAGIPIWNPLRPFAVRAAAEIINSGQMRRLDLGRVRLSNGKQRYFFMWCGVGFDAAVTREISSDDTRRLGLIAWAIAGMMVAVKFMGYSGHVQVDGEKERKRILWAVVSNGQLYGRLWRIAPHAKMDDGHLDLTVFEGYSVLSTLRHFLSLTFARSARDPTIHQYVGDSIFIRARKPLPVHVDAELFGNTPIQVEIVPQALSVILPPHLPAHILEGTDAQRPPGLLSAWNETSEFIAQRARLRISDLFRDSS